VPFPAENAVKMAEKVRQNGCGRSVASPISPCYDTAAHQAEGVLLPPAGIQEKPDVLTVCAGYWSLVTRKNDNADQDLRQWPQMQQD
jgi:hypothetical protein